MPHLLKHVDCGACGHRHHFCLDAGELETGQRYEYVCPETGRTSHLQSDGEAEEVHAYPQGAVLLTAAAAKRR